MTEVLKPIPFVFFKTANGREPVRDWLNGLARDEQRAIGRDIAKIQFGWPIGLPVCRPLGEGLWEVRSTLQSKREARILFGFHDGTIVALTGFIKKSRLTPAKELELARMRLKDLER